MRNTAYKFDRFSNYSGVRISNLGPKFPRAITCYSYQGNWYEYVVEVPVKEHTKSEVRYVRNGKEVRPSCAHAEIIKFFNLEMKS